METQTEKQNGKEPVLEPVEETTTMSLDTAEVNVQVATAKKWPRSLTRFKERAIEMATMDQEVAEACFYILPRKDKDGAIKNIEGQGVRLAEIIGSAYGNMRCGARMVGDDGKYVIAQGAAFDLENNVAMTIEVRRRITNKYGQRYSDDMVALTANAACSIALRNAIFRVVPKALVEPIYKAAKQAAIGDAKTLSSRREKMLAHFAKMGVDKSRLFQKMEVKGVEDIGLEKLEELIGLSTAIKDGDINVDQAFPTEKIKEEIVAANKVEAVANKMKKETL